MLTKQAERCTLRPMLLRTSLHLFVRILPFACGAVALAGACTDDDLSPSPGAIDAGGVDVTSPGLDAALSDATPADVAMVDAPSDVASDVSTSVDAGEAGVDADADAGPDRRIVFVYANDIWVMDPDGSNRVNLTSSPSVNDVAPAWSPDHKKIAFQSDMDDGSGEIYVMDDTGGNVVRLTVDVGEADVAPAWSPDGTKIAFESRRDHTVSSIYVMDAANGANVIRVTNATPASDQSPSWSAGNKIAFFTNEGSIGLHIAVVDLDLGAAPDGGADGGAAWGTNRNGFVGDPAFGLYASWSPDGTKIAFGGDAPGVRQVYVMNANGSSQTRLSTSGLAEDWPRWSPDGTELVFQRNVGGRTQLFKMPAGGGAAVQITDSDAGSGSSGASWH